MVKDKRLDLFDLVEFQGHRGIALEDRDQGYNLLRLRLDLGDSSIHTLERAGLHAHVLAHRVIGFHHGLRGRKPLTLLLFLEHGQEHVETSSMRSGTGLYAS